MKLITLKQALCLFAFSGFLWPVTVFSQETLRLSATQLNEMGITVSSPQQVTSVVSGKFPAKITIPNAQIRVLSPILSGVVSVLYVAEGDQITKGQKLAEISSPDFLEAQQNYLDALSRLDVASRNHDRNKELFDEGIISEKVFMAGRSSLQEANTLLARGYQTLSFSGMREQQIEALKTSREINRTMGVYAPFDGSVLEQTVTPGEHVNETTSIFHVGQLEPLWIEIHVPFSLRNNIQLGGKINVDGLSVDAEVITIGRMIHEEDQGILVRGLLSSTQNKFIPGQFVNATVEQKLEQGSYYRIPAGSVIREGDDVTLFVRNNDGFSLESGQIIADEGMFLVISSSISQASEIATSGIVTLKGMLEGLGSEE